MSVCETLLGIKMKFAYSFISKKNIDFFLLPAQKSSLCHFQIDKSDLRAEQNGEN